MKIQRSKNGLASKLVASAIGVAGLVGATSGAHAQRISQLAPPSVSTVISDPATAMRVVAGSDGTAYLAVEKIDNGRISQQSFLRDVTFADGAVLKLDRSVVALQPTSFLNGNLDFTIDLGDNRRPARCATTVDPRKGRIALRATCEGNGTVSPVTPTPLPPVGACTVKRSNAVGGNDWSRGLALDVDQRFLGAKITKYRILWSPNQWTSWFEPGKNDVDATRNADGSQRRVWAYFTDHAFEYEVCPYPVNPNPIPNPNPTPYPVAPPPPAAYQPTVQDIQNATVACSAAYSFKSEVEPCVNQTVAMLSTPFGASAFKAVAACQRAFTFTSDRKTCMSVAATSRREPVELIDFCAKNNTFDSEKVACLKKWAK